MLACIEALLGFLVSGIRICLFKLTFLCRVPTPVAIGISAAVFALAHLTPGEFAQLFVLGMAPLLVL